MIYYNVVLRDLVYGDIEGFANYAYENTLSLDLSNKTKELLFAGIYSLQFLPYRFQEIENGYRSLIVKGIYKIIYKIIEEDRKVVIVRIIRSEANMENFF